MRGSVGRLRLVLGAVLVFLSVPTLVLAYLAQRQLEFEAFYHHQSIASELTNRIDRVSTQLFALENQRSPTEFTFAARSPIGALPIDTQLPGVVSYFQVDADGRFTTPLLPADESADTVADREAREALEARALAVLSSTAPRAADDPEQLTEAEADATASIEEAVYTAQRGDPQKRREISQTSFDRLSAPQEKRAESPLGNVRELKLKESYADQPVLGFADSDVAGANATAESFAPSGDLAAAPKAASPIEPQRVLATFESEVDPFRFEVVDANHFMMFRNVWRGKGRTVQGAVIDRNAFIDKTIGAEFKTSTLESIGNLVVAHRDELVQTFVSGEPMGYRSRASDITGTALYTARLTTPLNDVELIFSFDRLPTGPGGQLVNWTTAILLLILLTGFAVLYRLGIGQIRLAQQQQDFVAAVSHEFKTPLTSIRMYGEILQAGWADEEKKRTYYDYICQESDRLTRLVNNVLQLARITRADTVHELAPTAMSVAELSDLVRSHCANAVTQAGFTLTEDHPTPEACALVDADAFSQIMINLVDNALKFSATANRREVVFATQVNESTVTFSIRDFGPGIPPEALSKIFKLFYRTERELTRETVGTGIGLALVNELAHQMDGNVDVANREPGAEFRLQLPRQVRAEAAAADV